MNWQPPGKRLFVEASADVLPTGTLECPEARRESWRVSGSTLATATDIAQPTSDGLHLAAIKVVSGA